MIESHAQLAQLLSKVFAMRKISSKTLPESGLTIDQYEIEEQIFFGIDGFKEEVRY